MKKIVVFISILCLTSLAFGQSITQDSLLRRISALEATIKTQNESITNLKGVEQLSKDFPELSSNPIIFVAKKLGLGILFFIGSLVLLFVLIQQIKPDWYTFLIQKYIERFESINTMKKNKKIVLLNAHGANKDFLQSFLRKKEFLQVEVIDITDQYIAPSNNFKQFQILITNCEGLNKPAIPQDVFHTYLDKHKDMCLLFYGIPGGWDFTKNTEHNKFVSAANMRSQLYGNLISVMEYHEKM